jgi:hypothetical protein
MEVTGSESGSSISIDFSNIDVFISDWVMTTWSCEFIDCCDDRVIRITMKSKEKIIYEGDANHNEVAFKGGSWVNTLAYKSG